MARIFPVDGEGENSQNGAFTNPIFTNPQVGDVAVIQIVFDEAGFESPDFTPFMCDPSGAQLTGAPIRLSATGNENDYHDATNTGLMTYAGKQLWLKCFARPTSAVCIAFPQDGIVATSENVANAGVQSGTGSLPGSSVVADVTVDGAVQAGTGSLPGSTGTAAAGGDETVTAGVQTGTGTLPGSTATADQTVNAGVQAGTGSLPGSTGTAEQPPGLANGTYYFKQNAGQTATDGFGTTAPAPSTLFGSYFEASPSLYLYAKVGNGAWVASSVVNATAVKTIALTSAGGETTLSIGMSEEGSPPPYTWDFTLPSALGAGKSISVQLNAQSADGIVLGTSTKIVVS